jgi:hypothetical protein
MVRASVAERLEGITLELAFGEADYVPVRLHVVSTLSSGAPVRNILPGDKVGNCGAFLFVAPRIRTLTPAMLAEALRERRLVCATPGNYKLRATIHLHYGDRETAICSNSVGFAVRVAGEGFDKFLELAQQHVVEMHLSPSGYRRAEDLLRDIGNSAYGEGLRAMTMEYLLQTRMTDETDPNALPDDERHQRGFYKDLAEAVLRDHVRPTMLREIAFRYMLVYHAQAKEYEKALSVANQARREMPWSVPAQTTARIERAIQRAGHSAPTRTGG